MPRAKLHAASPQQPSKPLCGRQLARQGSAPEAHKYIQGTHTMAIAAAGDEVNCRHCLRAMGLLAPLAGRSFNSEGDLEIEDQGDDNDC